MTQQLGLAFAACWPSALPQPVGRAAVRAPGEPGKAPCLGLIAQAEGGDTGWKGMVQLPHSELIAAHAKLPQADVSQDITSQVCKDAQTDIQTDRHGHVRGFS